MQGPWGVIPGGFAHTIKRGDYKMSTSSDNLSRDLQLFLKHASSKPNFYCDAIGWEVDPEDLKHPSIRPIKRNVKDFCQQYEETGFEGIMFSSADAVETFLTEQLKLAEEIYHEVFG